MASGFPASPPRVGGSIGHYELLEELGEGATGTVYLARDTRLGRRVALKILSPDLVERAECLSRFEREARALASLNHPNIVTIHSVEEGQGTRFFTMEYVPGTSLDELIPPAGWSSDVSCTSPFRWPKPWRPPTSTGSSTAT